MPWVKQADMDAERDRRMELIAKNHDLFVQNARIANELTKETTKREMLEAHCANLSVQFTNLLDTVVKLKLAGAEVVEPAKVPRVSSNRPSEDQLALTRADNQFIESYVAAALSTDPSLKKSDVEDEARRIRREEHAGIPG